MPSKQLEIIVEARDQATSTFGKVGDGAHALAEKMRGVSETGHGLQKSFRALHHAFLAFELVPVGFDAINAVFKTLTGTTEEAAESQRKLIDSLKELPIVGKMAGKAAEGFGEAVSHALGKETLAEVEAGIAAQKKALADYAAEIPKIAATLRLQMNAGALIGLDPGDQEIEKAKQKFREAQEKIHEQKAVAIKAQPASEKKIEDKQRELAELAEIESSRRSNWSMFQEANKERSAAVEKARMELARLLQEREGVGAEVKSLDKAEVEAARVRDAEIAIGQLKRLQSEREYHNSLLRMRHDELQQMSAIAESTFAFELTIGNRGYEAKLAGLNASLAMEVDAIRESSKKKQDQYQRDAERKQLLADQGNTSAGGDAFVIRGYAKEEAANEQFLIALVRERALAAMGLERQNQARAISLEILRAEGDAGNAAARFQADRLSLSIQQEAAEKALRAIANDALATDAQRAEARKNLVELSKAKAGREDFSVQQSGLEILERQAALGDVSAGAKAQQIRLTLEQQAAEARLNDIIAEANKPIIEDDKAQELRAYRTKKLTEMLHQQNRTARERADIERQLGEATGSTNAARAAKAEEQLKELRAIPAQRTDNAVRDQGLWILQQEASLGDKAADRQLKKIELERQFSDERKKSLSILQSETSTESQKANAKKLLGSLDAVQKRAMQQLGGPDNSQPNLAAMVESQYLSGRSAGIGQEKDQYAPIIDPLNKGNTIAESIAAMMKDFLTAVQNGGRPAKKLT